MKFINSAIVLAATLSSSEAIRVEGNNNGLGAILGAIISGGNNGDSSCGCNVCPCPEKGPSSREQADKAARVIKKATDNLEDRMMEKERQKDIERGLKKAQDVADKAQAEKEDAAEAAEVRHAVHKAEHQQKK